MAKSVLELAVGTGKWDAGLKKAVQSLNNFTQANGGLTQALNSESQKMQKFVSMMGSMESSAKTAKGQMNDYKSTIEQLTMQYNRMTEGTIDEKMAYYASLPKPWYKIVTRQDEKYAREVADALSERYGDLYEFDRSYAEGIEIHQKGSGKGACMEWVKAHLDAPVRVTIAAGDYENDISMLKRATVGYAVENAIDAVKQAADRITSANTQDAIARIIEDLSQNPPR